MVKLLRTDTTLDLSQKARVVRNRDVWEGLIYSPGLGARTMFGLVCPDFGRQAHNIWDWLSVELLGVNRGGHS